ncbi:MAG: hypothetical protein K8H84_00145 [Sulfuricella denitrificans]|nr:hypothetical protein [Sulfuricella denitrificans]
MAFRKTRRSKEVLANMRSARDANRMDSPAPEYPPELPELRRRIIIQDFDFGERIHTLDLYRTNRVDCYRVVADGVPWKKRMGWSRILAGLRKSMPRVSAAD